MSETSFPSLKRHRSRLVARARFLGTLVALFGTTPAIATSVVALLDRRNHQVVIAADSLERFQGTGKTQKRCKIIMLPRCAFGMAGMYNKPHPHFDLEDLARKACGARGDLRLRADSFLEIAKPPVVSLIQYLRENEPRYYIGSVANGKADFINVLFVGVVDGHLSIFARGFRVGKDGSIKTISDDITEMDPQGGIGFFGGANEAILSYIQSHNEWEQRLSYTQAARIFVKLEIDADAENVGPPIAVLRIDRLGGMHWVRLGVCTCRPQRKPGQAREIMK